jgi:hypothetical protein
LCEAKSSRRRAGYLRQFECKEENSLEDVVVLMKRKEVEAKCSIFEARKIGV